jgi:iron complex transport system substrate-binding protein
MYPPHTTTPDRRVDRTIRPRIARVAGAVAALALLAGACGDGGDESADGTTGASTVPAATATEDTTAVTAAGTAGPDDAPERIVSLSPTHTEMLFAIGAGDLLVAVDDNSNFPAAALELPNDLSGFEPNVEAIAAYEPDLVVIGGDFTGLGVQLDALGIEWWDGPAALTLDDTYAQIEELGAVTGQADEATALVEDMQADIDEIVGSTPRPPEPLTIYHELDPTYYSADSTTFVGELYSLFGLRNIADGAEGDSGGFPQLNAEFIVSADPDLIFLADTKCCGESPDTVAARPGWDAIAAVRNGNVFPMDDDIASRWGPRVVDYLTAVSAAVQQATG